MVKKESADKKFYSLLESGIELIGKLNMAVSVRAGNFVDWADIVNTSLVLAAREIRPRSQDICILRVARIRQALFNHAEYFYIPSSRRDMKLSFSRMPYYRVSGRAIFLTWSLSKW